MIRAWDISSDAFYNYLEKKIAAEISANTGRTIRPADFSGFKYRKKGEADINITIVAYKRPGLCKVTARSMQETITNTFVIKEKDGKLEVTMTASISAYESQKNKHVIMEAALLFLCLAFPHGQSTGQYVWETTQREKTTAGSKANAGHQCHDASVMQNPMLRVNFSFRWDWYITESYRCWRNFWHSLLYRCNQVLLANSMRNS